MKALLKAFPGLGGWKTNVATMGLLFHSLGGLMMGTQDFDAGISGILAALAVWGIGHKIEKGPQN